MNYNEEEQRLKQRQQALEQREQEIRLRELELEIARETQETEPPLYQTRKENSGKKSIIPWWKKLLFVGKLFVLMVVVFVATKIAYWLALGILVSSVTWASYKLFLEGEPSNNKK
ncbi:hypothetical protein [Crocosphaera sp.]|uniref:hypothetical protein n=1 Tax=Crocosphaera sp. TaxID=2729996 RepID=UPI003F277C92|nr:hypothetical protein [Crocosphaera sp.]